MKQLIIDEIYCWHSTSATHLGCAGVEFECFEFTTEISLILRTSILENDIESPTEIKVYDYDGPYEAPDCKDFTDQLPPAINI